MIPMAVELHPREELFLSSSSAREFRLSHNQNDVVVNDDDDHHASLDLISLEKCFDETQKPWDFETDSSDSSELIGSSDNHSESETDKSKDDCFAELTLQMADQDQTNQSWDFGGWPSMMKIWSPFGSSYGSSEEGPSQETTPPTTPAMEKRHYSSWDSGNITANMEKMNIEGPKYQPITKDRFGQNQAPTDHIDHQIRAIQLYKMEQKLMLKQQRSKSLNQVINKKNDHQMLEGVELNNVQFFGNGKREKANYCGSEWAHQPPGQQWASHRQHHAAAGSGMRAVFLDRPGSKSGQPCGTGVFLPCVIGDTSHSRKKKGCSPVLIPAKVMQALKAHFERMDNLSPHNISPNNLHPQYDNTNSYAPKRNSNGILYSEKKHQPRAVPATTQNDIGLPQDWTY